MARATNSEMRKSSAKDRHYVSVWFGLDVRPFRIKFRSWTGD